jgi:carbon storage regulator
MLVLTRKTTESVVIAHSCDLQQLVRVTVIDISGGKVKLGFEAKNDLTIHRNEVWERVCGERSEDFPSVEVERPKCGVNCDI